MIFIERENQNPKDIFRYFFIFHKKTLFIKKMKILVLTSFLLFSFLSLNNSKHVIKNKNHLKVRGYVYYFYYILYKLKVYFLYYEKIYTKRKDSEFRIQNIVFFKFSLFALIAIYINQFFYIINTIL